MTSASATRGASRPALLGALGQLEAMSVVLVTPVAKPPPAKP
jgi:hypothetical protein